MVLAADITAFHVVGGVLALWAVILAALGIMREDFPPKGLEKVIMGISALLVVGAIGTAIGTSGEKKPKGSEQAGFKNKSGKEGSSAPNQGGTPAPGTGSQNTQGGQEKSGQAPTQGTSQTLTLSADPTGQLRFDKSQLSATAGNVKLVMNNPAPVPHNISIEGPNGLDKQGPVVPKGGSSQVSAKLAAGTYTYYCSVPGHRQAGMEGTLTVK